MGAAVCQGNMDECREIAYEIEAEIRRAQWQLPDSPTASKKHSRSSIMDILTAADSRPASAASAAESQSLDNGEHTLRWIDGASYTGSLKTGKMHGYGEWTSANERTTYAGEWLEDQWHGKREQVCKCGTYNGEFQRGAFDGRGVVHWIDGRYYEGQWKQGKRHGDGLNRNQRGQQKVGRFYEDRFVGSEADGVGSCLGGY